jgi:hypothetical protein
MPNYDRLIMQLVGLERRVGSSGKDTITHAPQGHDDIANSVAGCAMLVFQRKQMFGPDAHWVSGDPKKEAEADANARWRAANYFRNVFGGGGNGRVIDWSRMP